MFNYFFGHHHLIPDRALNLNYFGGATIYVPSDMSHDYSLLPSDLIFRKRQYIIALAVFCSRICLLHCTIQAIACKQSYFAALVSKDVCTNMLNCLKSILLFSVSGTKLFELISAIWNFVRLLVSTCPRKAVCRFPLAFVSAVAPFSWWPALWSPSPKWSLRTGCAFERWSTVIVCLCYAVAETENV